MTKQFYLSPHDKTLFVCSVVTYLLQCL